MEEPPLKPAAGLLSLPASPLPSTLKASDWKPMTNREDFRHRNPGAFPEPTSEIELPSLGGAEAQAKSELSSSLLHRFALSPVVPCYSFKYGLCSKGDGCSYSHDTDTETPEMMPLSAAYVMHSGNNSSHPYSSTHKEASISNVEPSNGVLGEQADAGNGMAIREGEFPHRDVKDNVSGSGDDDHAEGAGVVDSHIHQQQQYHDEVQCCVKLVHIGDVDLDGNVAAECDKKEVDSSFSLCNHDIKVEAGDGRGGEPVNDRVLYDDKSDNDGDEDDGVRKSRMAKERLLATPLSSTTAFDLREHLRKRKGVDGYQLVGKRMTPPSVDFTGPKSLAQIKEEKRRAEEMKACKSSSEGSRQQNEEVRGHDRL